mmetsp:Transcript_102808/g.286342  ORF Transcript_102808/g.286342 Transcript_102808/m.286342 type:complete len:260 (-) Transcript_102808:499-1278(-)
MAKIHLLYAPIRANPGNSAERHDTIATKTTRSTSRHRLPRCVRKRLVVRQGPRARAKLEACVAGPCASRLVLQGVARREAAERPQRKDVSERGVGYADRPVEDARDVLLGPISARQLPPHQELDAFPHNGGLLALRGHEGQQRPSGADHGAAAVAPVELVSRGILSVEAAREVLAPAAVGVLLAEQEAGTALNRLARCRPAGTQQALDPEPAAVGEAIAPATIPTAVVSLHGLDEGRATLHCDLDLSGPVVRELLAEAD